MALDAVELGKAIAQIRKARGLTQKAVAEQSGLTVNYLSLLENGERQPSTETLNRLSKVFQVPAEWIPFLGAKAGPYHSPLAELSKATKEAMWSAIAALNECKQRKFG
jgi:transcriptional regulator with XRE-family HTH domain